MQQAKIAHQALLSRSLKAIVTTYKNKTPQLAMVGPNNPIRKLMSVLFPVVSNPRAWFTNALYVENNGVLTRKGKRIPPTI